MFHVYLNYPFISVSVDEDSQKFAGLSKAQRKNCRKKAAKDVTEESFPNPMNRRKMIDMVHRQYMVEKLASLRSPTKSPAKNAVTSLHVTLQLPNGHSFAHNTIHKFAQSAAEVCLMNHNLLFTKRYHFLLLLC